MPVQIPLFDLLAERGGEDDALCAVCAGGESSKMEANEIVFCERCDVAVHQKCYGVDSIPTGMAVLLQWVSISAVQKAAEKVESVHPT